MISFFGTLEQSEAWFRLLIITCTSAELIWNFGHFLHKRLPLLTCLTESKYKSLLSYYIHFYVFSLIAWITPLQEKKNPHPWILLLLLLRPPTHRQKYVCSNMKAQAPTFNHNPLKQVDHSCNSAQTHKKSSPSEAFLTQNAFLHIHRMQSPCLSDFT